MSPPRTLARVRASIVSAWLLVLILALGWAPRALAEPRVIVVLPFQGPGAARVRDAVVAALARDARITLLSNERVARSERAQHASVASAAGRAAVANDLAIRSFIEGRVRRRGAISELELRIYQGADGALVGRNIVRARHVAFVRAVRMRLSDELAPRPGAAASAQTTVEPDARPASIEAEPTPEVVHTATSTPPAPAEPDAPSAEPEASSIAFERARQPAAFELDAMLELATRDYAYVDAQSNLAEQSMAATPGARLHLRWYPAANAAALAAALGVDAYAASALPMDTVESVSVYPTHTYGYGLGLHARVPFAQHELGALIGYGHHGFDIADSKLGEAAQVPSVSYDFVRFGADLRLALGAALALQLHAAYLWMQGFGELAKRDWFPHTTGGGVEAGLGFAYSLSAAFELRASAGVERYFMTLHPRPGDSGVVVQHRVAGGAVDQYLRASLALGFRFPR